MIQGAQPYSLDRDEGESFWFLGTLATLKATAENTHRVFGLVEQILPPGFAPPLHVHHGEDEAFYVLEGKITFTCGDKIMPATSGTFVFLPRDVPHWFLVEGDGPARLLQLTTPGGFERFLSDMGEPAQAMTLPPSGQPDMQKMLQLATEYAFEILGPPPVRPESAHETAPVTTSPSA